MPWKSQQRLCRKCGETDPTKFQARLATLCGKCRQTKYHTSQVRSRIKGRNRDKVEVLTHYGPQHQLRCSWQDCDVTDADMLVIDHIADNGAKERQLALNSGRGHELYRRLRKENYPIGYQTLCCNHNTKKEILRRRNNRLITA